MEVGVAVQGVGSPGGIHGCLTKTSGWIVVVALKEPLLRVEGWRQLLSWVLLDHNTVKFFDLYWLLRGWSCPTSKLWKLLRRLA